MLKYLYPILLLALIAPVVTIDLSVYPEIIEGNENHKGEFQIYVSGMDEITQMTLQSGSEIIDVKLKAEKIDNKTDILVQFENAHNNNLYVAYEDDELDIKEYEKEQKEKEQAIENVVVPETLQIEDKTIYK